MAYRLIPDLSDGYKDSLADFIMDCLNSPMLDTNSYSFPLQGMVLYDGVAPVKLHSGYWKKTSDSYGNRSLYLAAPSSVLQADSVSIGERFKVLLALVPLVREQIDAELISKSICKIMLNQYQELTSALTTVPADKLAFNADGRVLALHGEAGWFTTAGVAHADPSELPENGAWTILEV